MGVDFGCSRAFMAQELLDVAQVGAVFQKVGGEGVTERVETKLFGDGCPRECPVKYRLGGTDGEVVRNLLPREEPTVNHKVVPVFSVESLDAAREDGVAILVSLGSPDMEKPAIEVKVADLQADDLTHPQAAGVCE